MHFKSFFSTAITAATLIAASAPAPAQDLAPHLGPMADAVSLGQQGIWTFSVADGWFDMANGTDPAAIGYVLQKLGKPLAPGRQRIVRVVVLPRAEARQGAAGGGDFIDGAGLIFNVRDAGNDGGQMGYMILAITLSGKVRLLVHKQDGSDGKYTDDSGLVRLDGTDVLEIREGASEMKLLVNGAELFTITNENGFPPTYGIAALGIGRMGFTGFSIREE